MAIEVITASTMTSNATAHSAQCIGEDRWVVSWLPDRTLTGEQAVTAMTIASTVASRTVTAGDPEWAVLDDWALELGLTAPEAIGLACRPRHHPNTVATVVPTIGPDRIIT